MKFFLPSITLLISCFQTFAQEAILQFNAVQVETRVQLNFTIKAGNTCNGIDIYRSPDSVNFSLIGDIQGVCGSADKNESYVFTDFSPLKNSKNYYRLQLGTLGTSGITSVFYIDLSETEVLVFPNPVSNSSAVHFLNTAHEERALYVFNRQGKLVYESAKSRSSFIPIPAVDLIPGIYYFSIRSGELERFKGSFTVR